MALGKKTGGRTKGTPNKITSAVREAILQAFDEAGGVEYLKQVAQDEPRVFCTLLGKILPLQMTGEDGGEIVIRTIYEDRPADYGDAL